MNWAEHSEEIEAPIETCFAAITDYESFPGWQDAVDSVEVIDRTEDGIGRNVRLFVDAKVRKIDYVLAYRYQRPTTVEWDFVEGNGMNAMDGTYSFEELGPGRTRATYDLGADPAIPVPGMIMRRTHKQLVKRSVEDLKREAERRHAAGEAAPAPAEGGAEADRPDPAAGSGAPPAPAPDDWVPKAAREAHPPTSRPASPGDEPRRPGRAGQGSPGELPAALLGKAASTGREAAEGAMRAGIGAAGAALGVGREVADGLIRRVNRKLGADRVQGDGESGDEDR